MIRVGVKVRIRVGVGVGVGVRGLGLGSSFELGLELQTTGAYAHGNISFGLYQQKSLPLWTLCSDVAASALP